MKKFILFIICGMLAIGVKAQTTTDEIALIQSMYGVEKKQLVTDLMQLDATETIAFWPIYDKYEAARKELGKNRIKNIENYAMSYSSMTDPKATELINAALSNQSAFVKLLQKTFKEMSKAITPIRAAQFVQFESYLETSIRKVIADEIPLVKKMDSMEKK